MRAMEWIDDDGWALQATGSNWGMSSRKRAKEALETNRHPLGITLEAARIGTFEWDVFRNRLTSSRVYEELCGFRSGELNGAQDAFLKHVYSEDLPSVKTAISRCIAAQTPFVSEFRVVWPDRSLHWLLVRGAFSFDALGQPLELRGVAIDLDERKEQEKSLQKEVQEAEDSDRDKSDLLAYVSHEIRTPLTAIIGMTSLAIREGPGSRQDSYLAKIGRAAGSLLAITNDLLDLSKSAAGKLKLEQIPFRLDDILTSLKDIVNSKAAQKGIEVVFSVASGTPRYLLGDPLRVSQILINLLNNAVKFTEKGEILVNVVATQSICGQWIFSFSVTDSGIGMASNQISTLFQPYTQADTSFSRKYGGTGLGLTISKQLSDLMDGTIAVESELGKGSTFRFEAPFKVVQSELPVSTPMSEQREESGSAPG